jgi:hypothetical protein
LHQTIPAESGIALGLAVFVATIPGEKVAIVARLARRRVKPTISAGFDGAISAAAIARQVVAIVALLTGSLVE